MKTILLVLLSTLSVACFAMSESEYLKGYPLPEYSPEQCERSSIDSWMLEAEKLIDSSSLITYSKKKKNQKLEDHIKKNALITLAYSRLARRNNQSQVYPLWLFAGANASFIVGKSLKLNYKYINKLPLEPEERFGFMANQAFKKRMLGEQVAYGNQSVYRDIFWQFLAAYTCDTNLTVKLLESKKWKYSREIKAWSGFHSSSFTMKDKSLRLALDYVDIEQGLLQNIMYDKFSSKIGNALKIFNNHAKLELLMPDAPTFLSFDEYIFSTNLWGTNNLANYKSRVGWMKYLLSSISPFAADLYEKKRSFSAFRELMNENLLIIHTKSRD